MTFEFFFQGESGVFSKTRVQGQVSWRMSLAYTLQAILESTKMSKTSFLSGKILFFLCECNTSGKDKFDLKKYVNFLIVIYFSKIPVLQFRGLARNEKYAFKLVLTKKLYDGNKTA